MSPIPARPDWDIFCRVIDNFGDIGVCWRLARQLAGEHQLRVRLWVDDLDSFRMLCPQLDPLLPKQSVLGIEICRWAGSIPAVTPALCVLEGFACHLPPAFIASMAELQPPPVWINLDHLSAEQWVPEWHALPSPHPRLPLVKYFFFPGFTADTGGLLRERDLHARREAFTGNAGLRLAWWRKLGFAPPLAGTLLVSLFTYENPAIKDLLHAWETSGQAVCCLLPRSRSLTAIEAYAGRSLGVGDVVQGGALEIRILPFVEQRLYDQLLWLCDLNFVRGEDSFVRAQWAGRPLVWHIYPQAEAAHLGKLDAFLARYRAGLPQADSAVLAEFWHAWNGGKVEAELWRRLASALPSLRQHARRWDEALALQADLASRLVSFAASRL